MSECFLLIDLPNEILEKILSYLSYDEIAKNRVVCRKFNTTCSMLLNIGFLHVERRHSALLKNVKARLPRRESERRAHSLARHSDILYAIEARIGMLKMTFMKYVDKNLCCFIPGKVIDEILRVLRLVSGTCTPPRTHEVLQELRDISCMAMEHFDEKIAPNLKLPYHSFPLVASSASSIFSPQIQDLFITKKFRRDFTVMQQQSQTQKKQISFLKDLVTKLHNTVKRQNSIMHMQLHKIREQSSKIKDQNTSIAELKRHVQEWDTKFENLVQKLEKSEVNETKSPQIIQKNVINNVSHTSAIDISHISSPITTIGATSSPRLYIPNIKPRKASILSRSLSFADVERKRKLPLTGYTVPTKISRLQLVSNIHESNQSNNLINNEYYRNARETSLLKLRSFLGSSLETLIKSPISSIKAHKRKLQ